MSFRATRCSSADRALLGAALSMMLGLGGCAAGPAERGATSTSPFGEVAARGEADGAERGLELEPSAKSAPSATPPKRTTPAFEKARAVYARRIALVVGVDAYRGAIPPLRFAVADARRTAALFRELGFEQVDVLENEAATKAGMLEALEKKLALAAGPNDLVVVYFAGHGVSVNDQGYLLPQDATKDVAASGLSVQRLKEVALRLKSPHVLFLADACFSGSLFRRAEPGADYNSQAYWDAVAKNRIVQVVSAGGADETVLEQDGWGVFTRTLHDGLGGAADANQDLVVTVAELGAFLVREVPTRSKDHQHPQWGWIDGTGMIALVDERQGPPEEGFLTRARMPAPLSEPLAPVFDAIARKELKKAEGAVRDLLLKEDRPYYHLVLAEIYLAADTLGNASLIEAELGRAEAGKPGSDELEVLLSLRQRLEKARRRNY